MSMIQAQLNPGSSKEIKPELVKSFSYSQATILKWISRLYCPEGFHLDPTYGKGFLYKGIPPPELRSDLYQKTPGAQKADCRNLPLKADSIKNIVFDPPFLAGGGENGIMTQKYMNFNTITQLLAFFNEALIEFKRVLKPGGHLIFKCQDTVAGRVNRLVGFAPKLAFAPKVCKLLLKSDISLL